MLFSVPAWAPQLWHESTHTSVTPAAISEGMFGVGQCTKPFIQDGPCVLVCLGLFAGQLLIAPPFTLQSVLVWKITMYLP